MANTQNKQSDSIRMAKFVCPRCLYETGVKCNLKKHLSRKELCLPGYSNMRPRTILYLAETNNELLLHEITENGGAVAAGAEARYAERIRKLEEDIRQLRMRDASASRGVQNNISTTNIATQNNTNMNVNMNLNGGTNTNSNIQSNSSSTVTTTSTTVTTTGQSNQTTLPSGQTNSNSTNWNSNTNTNNTNGTNWNTNSNSTNSTTSQFNSMKGSARINCTKVLSNFDSYLNEIKELSFESDQVEALEKDLEFTCLTSNQAYKIVEVLTFESNRLDIAKYLSDRMINRDKAGDLLPLFTFDSNKVEYKDYIR